jgi:hypothetical protein
MLHIIDLALTFIGIGYISVSGELQLFSSALYVQLPVHSSAVDFVSTTYLGLEVPNNSYA